MFSFHKIVMSMRTDPPSRKLHLIMDSCLNTILPILYILGISSVRYTLTAPEGCPSNCECNNKTDHYEIVCTKFVPHRVPYNTHLVQIADIAKKSSINQQDFSSISWAGVKELLLSSNSYIRGIEANAFSNVSGLTHLGIHFRFLTWLSPFAFADLQTLRVLDMSGNSQLSFSELGGALSVPNSLQNLQELILVDLNRDNPGEGIDSRFFSALADKPVRYLDLTRAHFTFLDLESFSVSLGDTIQVINMSHIYLDMKKALMYRNTTSKNLFPNLDIIDISYAAIPFLKTLIFVYTSLYPLNCYFPFVLSKQVKLNGISDSEIRINYVIRILETCQRQVRRRLELSNNHLVWMNISISPNFFTYQEVDVSNNGIMYLGTNLTGHLSEIVWANISGNKLSHMEQYPEFETLFQKNILLEWLDLSANGLTNIPRNIFQNNIKLKSLILKNNKLHGILFEIKHLQHLECLDVSENLIASFDNSALSSFGSLSKSNIKDNSSVKFSVRFMNNDLLCSCETMNFVRWFVSTDVRIDNRELYTCSLNKEVVMMDTNALRESEYQCEKMNIMIIVISVSLFCLCILVLTIGLSRYVCRRRRKIERIRRLIDRYRVSNPPNKYLLFLSFCSKDDDFVSQYVTNELHHRLKERVPNGENLICIGDQEFELGRYITEEIIKCIETSSVVIFIISKAFCESNYCAYETIVAQLERKPIILMFREEVDPKKLPKVLYKHFNQFVRVRWIRNGDDYVLKPDWNKVCGYILDLAGKSLESKGSTNEIELIECNELDHLTLHEI